MAQDINLTSSIGSFIPTTNIWDVSQLYDIDVNSDEFKELLVRLYQNVNNIALNLNIKDTGYYDVQEFLNSQLFFPNPTLNSSTQSLPIYRQVYRMVVNFGPLPNATTISIPHYIPVGQNYSFTRIYGTASNSTSTSFIPLPYSSATSNKCIELSVTNANIVITTSIDYSAYVNTYVVCEYIKS
jgi:hypothetical protein